MNTQYHIVEFNGVTLLTYMQACELVYAMSGSMPDINPRTLANMSHTWQDLSNEFSYQDDIS